MSTLSLLCKLVFFVISASLSGLSAFASENCGDDAGMSFGRGFHLGEVVGRPADEFREMAGHGATLVRFGIPLRACAGCSRFEWPAKSYDELLRTLDLAHQNGVRVVVVLRPPPDPSAELWKSASLQDSIVEIWRNIATALRGHKGVAAFDLVNEPHPNGSTFQEKEEKWEKLATRLIVAIRDIDPTRTVVFEPSPGARPMAFRYVKALPFDNLIYSVHFYEPFEFTHQLTGDPRFVDAIDYPSALGTVKPWDRGRLMEELTPVVNFSKSTSLPIYVGEFGAVRWAPSGARDRYISDTVLLFNRLGWSWTYHAFREWHGWDAEMNSDQKSRQRLSTSPAIVTLRYGMTACNVRTK